MRAAAVQLNSTADGERNAAAADRLTRAAAADGAELIVLPEKWSVLGSDDQMTARAEPLDGPSIRWARETARELGVDLVAKLRSVLYYGGLPLDARTVTDDILKQEGR